MLKEFNPIPGDIIVCRNGRRYRCVSPDDYSYSEYHKNKAIYGVGDAYAHMNWAKSDGIDENEEFDIVRIEKPTAEFFYPIPGDTIVCNDGSRLTCVDIERLPNYIRDNDNAICAIDDDGDSYCWKTHSGEHVYSDYNIKLIIDKSSTTVKALVDAYIEMYSLGVFEGVESKKLDILRILVEGETPQFKSNDDTWHDLDEDLIVYFLQNELEKSNVEFRTKSSERDIEITATVPACINIAPALGQPYWCPYVTCLRNGVDEYTWQGSSIDIKRLERNMCFNSEEDAARMSEMMLNIMSDEFTAE